MQPHDNITAFVETVCEQIRWKRARPRVFKEMEDHVTDQRDALMAQGLDEEAAIDASIKNTGDAAFIGAQLDQAHRPKPQWGMLGMTVVLLALGVLAGSILQGWNNDAGRLSNRLLSVVFGMAGMLAAYFFDVSRLGRFPKTVYLLVVALAIVTFNTSKVINGRSYYTQYVTLLFPLAFALILYSMRNRGYKGIAICGLAFTVPGAIALMVPSISGFMHFAGAAMILLGIAIWRRWFGTKRVYSYLMMIAPIFILAVMMIVSLDMNSYRWIRLEVAFNPSLDPNGAGYWGTMTRALLDGATLLGRGFVPDEYINVIIQSDNFFRTESLLAGLTSLVGWVAFAVIVCALLCFIIKGMYHCVRQRSHLGFFVSLAVILTLGMQLLSYVAYNLGITFASPISLPLISYAPLATVINMTLIGFMLSVFRGGNTIRDVPVTASVHVTKFFRFIERHVFTPFLDEEYDDE